MNPIPSEVSQFLETHIDSVDQLEILRVLWEDPDKEWRAVDLAGEAQTPAEAIGSHLAAMQGRGLLATKTRGTDLFCRYGAATPELAQKVSRLLQVYRERPVTMIKYLYARAKDPLKALADAFRLKKES